MCICTALRPPWEFPEQAWHLRLRLSKLLDLGSQVLRAHLIIVITLQVVIILVLVLVLVVLLIIIVIILTLAMLLCSCSTGRQGYTNREPYHREQKRGKIRRAGKDDVGRKGRQCV